MFEKKFVMTLLCLVVMLSFSATATRGANILFISSMTAVEDDALKAFMEGLGHTVTYFDDDEDEATTEAAAAAADLVFISESVGSGGIKNEITEIETPMIVGEPWAWDEMGLTDGDGGDDPAVTTDVEIVDPGHYLAAGLSGTVAVLTEIIEGGNLGKGITGPEATVIATATLSDGVTYDVIFVYDKGAALPVAPADGSAQVAADIRIGFGFHAICYPVLSDNAYALLGAAVDYALGLTGPPEPVDMEIGFAAQPPVIDGEVDETWADASTQYFVPLDDPANASGSWMALYDSVNLYVIVDITDDSLQNDSSSSWQDDSVELYFDGGNTKVNTPLSGDDHQYTFGWTTEEIQGTNIDGATEGIEHAQVDTDTGWRIEIKLPWLSLQGAEPQARDLIGIDFYYNDDDDGGDSRENKLLTFSTTEFWNDASGWGTAMLTADKRVDVTAPGDIVQGVPNDGLMDGDNFGWPGAETPDLAVDDDTSTKFLHFKGELEPTGFQVTPLDGATIVTGLTFTTANDAAERDPVTFELSGSNEGIDGPYELIASGDIVDFAQADAWPRFTMNATPISFDNDVAYAHYQVLFPSVRDAGSANSMQIAEVELLGVPAPAGPVGYWMLDDGEGTVAVDSSGNGNDGILNGTAMAWMPDDGMIGGTLSFDGTASAADYVEISTADISLAAGTVAMWGNLRPDPQAPDTRYFFGHTTIPVWNSRIQIYMDNADTVLDLGLGDSHNRHKDIMSLTTETWYHVALTWDGGNYVVYVNGEEKANGSYTGLDALNTVADIGNDGRTDDTGRTEAFNGLLDDVRIYDRALSADEIGQLAGVSDTVENLLQNPSFEEDEPILDDPDWVSWCTWNPAEGAGSNATIVDTESIDGTRSLRVEPIGAENWFFILVNISFPADLDKNYTAGFWAKAEATRPLTIQMKASDNSVDAWGATDFELTTEWAEYSYTSEVLHQDVKLEFLCAGSEVPFWLDLVSVYEAE